ncbi:MAG: hypothetical protein CM1200mP14_00640 [Gammaproteobacteria bacterium]|nr:MAG: hypothetical protein CM1200mP14_00640 [Gammaproteobacteria bacterium]
MRSAITDADIEREEVQYVNAHATGTPSGDPIEIEAIKSIFEDHASNLAVSSTKSVHGHLVGLPGRLRQRLVRLHCRRGGYLRRRISQIQIQAVTLIVYRNMGERHPNSLLPSLIHSRLVV